MSTYPAFRYKRTCGSPFGALVKNALGNLGDFEMRLRAGGDHAQCARAFCLVADAGDFICLRVLCHNFCADGCFNLFA